MIYTSPTGTKYDLQDRVDVIYKVLQDTGYFEDYIIDIIEAHLRQNPGTVIDVGANIGTVCIELATRFQDLQFHAFEPLDLAYKELENNIVLNGYTNIKSYNIALSDCIETLIGEDPQPIHAFGHIALKHHINVLRNTIPHCVTSYNAVTLDSFDFKNVSVLKIDVEGMEINVLRGAVDTIQQYRPMIIFEAWGSDWFVEERKKVVDFVRSLGYNLNLNYGDNIIAIPQ